MLFSVTPQFEKREKADVCIIPFWSLSNRPKAATQLFDLQSFIEPALDSGDFNGKARQMLFAYGKGIHEKRFLLLGLGGVEKLSVEGLRLAFGEATRACIKRGLSSVNILMPTVSDLRGLKLEECLHAVSEGILLANYQYLEKSGVSEDKFSLLKKVMLIGILPKYLSLIELNECMAQSVYLARDLINGSADKVTPDFLAKSAATIAKSSNKLKLNILNKSHLEKEGMNLLLAVGRGSAYEPALIVLRYEGKARSKDHTVLIGKGVTFDTGGINLKSTGSIETMRDDMSGAAAVLGIMAALPTLDLPINVTAVLPVCENAIDARSIKPGDIYKSLSGKSVEINNTDAEGRLILADAIEYAVKYLKPARIIDFATLTGTITLALGEQVSGLFCNDDKLAASLEEASEASGEAVWRMPLYAPYKEELKSDIADIKNTAGRAAGAIKAALFLQEFVKDIPWAHFDIAGTAFGVKELGYLPPFASGVGIRLMLSFLKTLSH